MSRCSGNYFNPPPLPQLLEKLDLRNNYKRYTVVELCMYKCVCMHACIMYMYVLWLCVCTTLSFYTHILNGTFSIIFCESSIPPTSLLPGAGYHQLGKAFLGEGISASTPEELKQAMTRAFAQERRKQRGLPFVINVQIDPSSSRKPQVNSIHFV